MSNSINNEQISISYNSDNMINLNKVRALSAIETARKSLYELELYIKSK